MADTAPARDRAEMNKDATKRNQFIMTSREPHRRELKEPKQRRKHNFIQHT